MKTYQERYEELKERHERLDYCGHGGMSAFYLRIELQQLKAEIESHIQKYYSKDILTKKHAGCQALIKKIEELIK